MTGHSPPDVFADRRLLEVDYLPGRDRIVDRVELIARLDDAVNPIIFGRRPERVLVSGHTGTGKTLCTRYVANRVARYAAEQGVSAAVAHVDCLSVSTKTGVVRTVAADLNDPDTTGLSIPSRGLSLSAYDDRLRTVLEECYDVVLFLFDRIDYAESFDVVARIAEIETDTCEVGSISISGDPTIADRMSNAVENALAERAFVFPPYDDTELRTILERRQDAFRSDSLEDGVIQRVVELSSEGIPDARTAIETLLVAGDIARAEDADTVRTAFVPRAHERVRSNRLREKFDQISGDTDRLLYALSTLTREEPDTDWFRTARVYEAYTAMCREQGDEPLTARRIRDLLAHVATLGITKRDDNWGGRAEGNYTTHQLLVEPEAVERAVDSQ